MHINKLFFPLTTFFLWLATAGAVAYSANTNNWNVDGLNGGVSINVTLMESPCSLADESAEQHLDFGKIPESLFSKIGALSASLPVHLILENCLFEDNVRSTEHGDGLYYLPSQPVVMMNIISDEDSTNPHLYRVYGEAQGIGLRLEDSNHDVIIPGERSRPQILNPGRNDLILNAQLSRTSQPLKLGDFQSVINVGLEYH